MTLTARRIAAFIALMAYGGGLAVLHPNAAQLPHGDALQWVRADPERAMACLCWAAGWLISAWFLLVTALSLAAMTQGPSRRGSARPGRHLGERLAARWARRLTPLAIRRLLEATLGVALAVGPAGAAIAAPSAGAVASPIGSRETAAAPALVAVPPPLLAPEPPIPDLDRPPAVVSTPVPRPKPAEPTRSPAPTTSLAPAEPVQTKPVQTEPVQTEPAAAPRAAEQAQGQAAHVVRAGDTLWDLASAALGAAATPLEITRAWQRWYAVNRAAIGDDPSFLLPGEQLNAPRSLA